MDSAVRMATLSDIDKLIKARFEYFDYERLEITDETRSAIEKSFRQYIVDHLNKDFFVAVIEMENDIVSIAFLTIREKLADPAFPTGKIGRIFNVLTYPRHRNKGFATCILRSLIEVAREQNLSHIELSASEIGLSLYEKLGFQKLEPTRFIDMKLSLM